MENFRESSDVDSVGIGHTSYLRPEWTEPSLVTPRIPFARKRLVIVARPVAKKSSGSTGLKYEFRSLCKTWRAQTQFLSDSHEVVLHRAYQRIIGMGAPAVPLVMEELQLHGGDWFWALSAMTGKDPTRPEDWGNFQLMKSAWITWWAANRETFS